MNPWRKYPRVKLRAKGQMTIPKRVNQTDEQELLRQVAEAARLLMERIKAAPPHQQLREEQDLRAALARLADHNTERSQSDA